MACSTSAYAPEETADVAKAALAQKSKARRDLNKLQTNKDKLGEILKGLKIDPLDSSVPLPRQQGCGGRGTGPGHRNS